MPYASYMNREKILLLVLLMALLASGEVSQGRRHVRSLLMGKDEETGARHAHKYAVAVSCSLDTHVWLVSVLRVVQIDDCFHCKSVLSICGALSAWDGVYWFMFG